VEALPSKISEYFSAISVGLGEKLAQLIFSLSILFGGVVIALVRGPVFTCICLAYTPFFVIIIAVFGMVTKKAQVAKLG
jgi:ABC-type multidrug transport system fused ATPase/permease subunit